MPRSHLPLVRLSLVQPFLSELERRAVPLTPVLEEFDLDPEVVATSDMFVPALTMYRLVEALAAAAGDPYLGVHVGRHLDVSTWPALIGAARHAGTLGDFLLRFAAGARDQASSVEMRLNTDGTNATFCAHRVLDPVVAPAQIDGFYVGVFTTLLQRCAGELWAPGSVLIRVCDLSAIPSCLRTLLLTEGDRLGPSIRFPQEWLLLASDFGADRGPAGCDAKYSGPPTTLEASVRQALLPHIHREDLKVEEAAMLCGYARRALGRKLRERGTTLAKLIAELRKERAREMLAETDLPVSEVGNAVGFADPTVFSRSFRNWTGESPRDYRRRHLKR